MNYARIMKRIAKATNKGGNRCGCREIESNSLRNEIKVEAQCNCACLRYKDGLRYFVVCLFCTFLVHDTS